MNEQKNEREISSAENEALEKMSHGLREIWKIIIFCCVGWLLITVGLKITPLLAIADREALTGLLTDEKAVPWYGQLMTTPQTIAYFVQMNDWLTRYKIQVRC